jgi:glycerol-3-phosphate dehydrogenase
LREEVTATYAGLRAASSSSDYQVHIDRAERYVCVGGIRSTGLSASLAIAEHVVAMLGEAGLRLRSKKQFARARMPPLGELQARAYVQPAKIAQNPDYGRIVCHCERVTKGEIKDALSADVPATTLDGLRRRTRCLQGRCQGFFCLAHVVGLLAEARGVPVASLLGGEPP